VEQGPPRDMPADLDTASYRTAISHFATGVTIVTSAGPDGPFGLTTNAVCSLSLEPVLMVACLDLNSRTLGVVRETGRLAVNVLSQGQENLAVAFASKRPAAEKFEGVPWRDVDGLPVLNGVVAWLMGDVHELIPGGDHVIAIVEVRNAGAPGGEPLVYYRSGYHSLGP
jgi:flavin reductase (DIM6/NTAB) family NADH-FMN oxidoreductase RutF